MSLQIPSTSKYSEKISEISALFKELVNNATTAVGSGIYELVIRPSSAIYAAISEEINKWYTEYTLSSLSKSTNTEPGPADSILSNYFITRNEGRQASAVLTVYSTDTFTKIPKGTTFSVDGILLHTYDNIFGSYLITDGDIDGVYSKAYKSGDFYCFTVPVRTEDPCSTVISEGTPVDMVSYIPNVDNVVLASALSGGSEVETDAEMVSRARDNIMSWIGSSASIHKILKTSGFSVYSSKSFDGSDKEMNRNTGSDLYINTGSMVDTYVKTSMYPMRNTVVIDTSNSTEVDITNHIHAGALSISEVLDENGNNIEYSVTWGSSDSAVTADGARFSVHQTTAISLGRATGSVAVTYSYMPYIAELQSFMDRPDNRLLGWDILIKAAIPAILNIRGSLLSESDDVENIIKDVVTYVNNTTVGIDKINLADIQSIIANNHKNILNSPVLMSVDCLDHGGNKYTCSSSSGVLDIPRYGSITPNMMFICVETSGVLIE